MKVKLHGFMKYLLVLLTSAFLGLSLLLITAHFPQERIVDNLSDSIDLLYAEGLYPVLADKNVSSKLDNYTDVAMLLESAVTNGQHRSFALTNPLYAYNDGESLIERLECYLNDMPHKENVNYYVRYWMGFRVLLRPALTFLNYFQIRRYLAVGFFALLIGVICSIAKRIDTKLAFLFGMSIVMVRPYVIVNSMQFSCCFYIMMIAMLLVPWIHDHPKWEGLFFFEIGIVTMYFDFYTVPLITIGFPMVYLFALRQKNGEPFTMKILCQYLLLWFAGYGLMWLAKLTLTSLLTDVDAFENGLTSLFGRLGVQKTPGLEKFYSISLAFEKLSQAIFCDREGKALYFFAAISCVIGAIISALHKKPRYIYIYIYSSPTVAICRNSTITFPLVCYY